jgi:ribonuclease Z
VSGRELTVLGTASQVPTRHRAHNALLLRWDDHDLLIDPGEAAQRQLTLSGLSTARITTICITHDHGDHCFGLPGILQRMALDGVDHDVDLYFPTEAAEVVDALVAAAPHASDPVRRHPVPHPGPVAEQGGVRLRAARLRHSRPTLGWRIDEPDGWRLVPDRLERAGVHGPARARLQRDGVVDVEGRAVHIEEVAVARPGQSVAVVMDTAWCDGALELAAAVDLLVVEATFLESERDRAEEVGHLTAAQAARLGAEAGARRVVLTHYSQRYPDLAGHEAEARAAAPDLDLVVARDLDRVAVPPRR